MLLHDDMTTDDVRDVADSLWYPLWDANIRLDHSVRTVAQTLKVASADCRPAWRMLDARHIAGDEELSVALIEGVRRQWRSRNPVLVRRSSSRDPRPVAALRRDRAPRRARPRNRAAAGLRDVQLLDALAIAQLIDRLAVGEPDDPLGSLTGAHLTLLNVRTELHRVSGRGRDQLLAQFADEISAALHIGDRFDLARMLSDAGRTISYHVEAGLRTAANALPRRGMSAIRRRPTSAAGRGRRRVRRRDRARPRCPTAERPGAGAAGGRRVGGHRPADCGVDAEPAGRHRAGTCRRRGRARRWTTCWSCWPQVRTPSRSSRRWTAPGCGAGCSRSGTRSATFRRATSSHIWTVDRHLAETVSRARIFTTRVARSDLLVLGALLHDIGKGRGVDHCVLGADLATQIGNRLGMWPSDVEMLSKLVRHHLLLPKSRSDRTSTTRRPSTRSARRWTGDPELLELLHALAEADSMATGPGVWSDWKASLVGDLVRRSRMVMNGRAAAASRPARARVHLAGGRPQGARGAAARRRSAPHHAVVIAPDQRGLLSKAAAVLTLNSLRVHSASVNIAGRRRDHRIRGVAALR